MPGNQPYFPGHPMLPLTDQVGYFMQSVFNGRIVPPDLKPLRPFHNVDIQPSDACPKNFVIFDQTHNRSQIMFHPEISSKYFHPGFGVDASMFQDNNYRKNTNDERTMTSPLKEDSEDIDALLSMEDEENEECDDEVVSTARTDAIYECNSPDSCSNYESLTEKNRPLLRKSYGRHFNEKKHHRTRKMMKALRGIVPGANRMSTVAVLDEAVRYLKSLRVEVQKLGVRNSKGYNVVV